MVFSLLKRVCFGTTPISVAKLESVSVCEHMHYRVWVWCVCNHTDCICQSSYM